MTEDASVNAIFRKEALAFSGRQSFGDVLVAQPLTYNILTMFLLSFTVLVVSYLWVGEYARKHTVTGYLMPDSGLVNIYPEVGGRVIDTVWIKEGDVVDQGASLLSLSQPNTQSDGTSTYYKVLQEFDVQKTTLQLRLTRVSKQFVSERNVLKSNLLNLEKESQTLINTRFYQREQINVADELVEAMDQLTGTGSVSRFRYLEAVSNQLQGRKELATIDQRIIELESRRRSTKHELDQIKPRSEDLISDIGSRISELNQSIAEVDSRREQLVVAPIAGRITAVQIRAGEVVRQHVSMFSIVPEDTELIAELLVPSSSIGFVKVGQSIQLLLDSFPYQQFGTHSAVVSSVSIASVNPRELSAPLGVKEAVYLVRANLSSQSIQAMGNPEPLQSGMLFRADIILENRSLINWLLEPLYTLRGR